MEKLILKLLTGACLLSLAKSLRLSEFYPYGDAYRDQSLPSDVEDISSPEIRLNTSIKFFNREYGSIFVRKTCQKLCDAFN